MGRSRSGKRYSAEFRIDTGIGSQYVGGFLNGLILGVPVTVGFEDTVAAFGFDIGGLGSTSFDVLIGFRSDPE